ncbi:cobalt-precorrin-6A reductase [Hahella sp. CCB-MM4]|nr:cobalt-precorrin-6A reductase [Hahella sp. CCB-MM4]
MTGRDQSTDPKTLLLLGGTADARRLAGILSAQGIKLIYSIAGLVRIPDVPCEVFSGGFSQVGGLPAFINDRNINAILDVTHPYASTMSETAVQAAAACKIPYWRFQRLAWMPQDGDDWTSFSDWNALLQALKGKKSVFLTAGQPDRESLDTLAGYQQQGQRQLLRTAVYPHFELPGTMKWVKAIGPFAVEEERKMLQEHGIDVLVSKNSGGDSTVAKITAAREMGIPVYMLERPVLTPVEYEFGEIAEAASFVVGQFMSGQVTKHCE